jgi:hypothetical protein
VREPGAFRIPAILAAGQYSVCALGEPDLGVDFARALHRYLSQAVGQAGQTERIEQTPLASGCAWLAFCGMLGSHASRILPRGPQVELRPRREQVRLHRAGRRLRRSVLNRQLPLSTPFSVPRGGKRMR